MTLGRSTGAAIAVVGSGPVGAASALLFATRGFSVDWYQENSPQPVGKRLVTLSPRSIGLLSDLGIWPRIAPQACPVDAMEVVVHDGPLIDLGFSGGDSNYLAQTVQLSALHETLEAAVSFQPRVARRGSWAARQVTPQQQGGGHQLLIGADGPQSAVRRSLRIGWSQKDYGQIAWTALLSVSQPQPRHALQWFRPGEVLAALPTLEDGVVSVVHSINRSHPAHSLWSAPDPGPLERLLGLQTQGRLGTFRALLGEGQAEFRATSSPLRMGSADRQSHGPALILGDAAHRVHPLAGLGLNLGLADVDSLRQHLDVCLLADPRLVSRPDAIRMARLAERVASSRRRDSRFRQVGIDLLHQAFVSDRALPGWIAQLGALALRSAPVLRDGLSWLGSEAYLVTQPVSATPRP